MVLILVLLLLPSCAAGVSTEEYAKVSSDLAVAQKEIETLQAKLDAKENELEATNEKLNQVKARVEVFNGLWIPYLEGRETDMAFFLELQQKVIALGDPVLTEKFTTLISNVSFKTLPDFYIYLCESTAKVLE